LYCVFVVCICFPGVAVHQRIKLIFIYNHNLHTDLMICRLGTTIRLLQEGEEAWIPKI
jgi:hypothetical protein